MDILLLLLGLVCMFLGVIGSFLPVLPGPSLSWLGLLLLHLTEAVSFSHIFLGITFVIALIITILDYIIPAMGTKRFGGSKAGTIGTTLGLIVGILSPIPFGILIGPFVGAFIGEFVFNQSSSKNALKAAVGSFIGLLASSFMKLIISMIYFGLFLFEGISEASTLFGGAWS